MKSLVTGLLLKLARKEEGSQDLVTQAETLERVIIEMLRNMAWSDRQIFIRQVEGALAGGNRIPAFLTNIRNAGECVPRAL